jgi:hypothetical protein
MPFSRAFLFTRSARFLNNTEPRCYRYILPTTIRRNRFSEVVPYLNTFAHINFTMSLKTILKSLLQKLGLLQRSKLLPYLFKTDSISRYLNSTDTGVQHTVVHSFDAFKQYKEASVSQYARWAGIAQKIMSAHNTPFIIKGGNFLSSTQPGYYRIDVHADKSYNLRESCVELQSELHNRVRATLFAIQQTFSPTRLRTSNVYLTEAVTPLYNWFSGKTGGLVGSEYVNENTKSGTVVNGIQHQDITCMSFADEIFDMGVCLEVLEHIPDYKKAFSELARVTSKGGSMFITVPFIEHNEHTTIRAELASDGTIIHHLPPEYHGDPVNPEGGILCFTHFGWDMLADLKQSGFNAVNVHIVWSAENLILGQPVMIFEAVK